MGTNKHNRKKIQSEEKVIALHRKWIADELVGPAPDWRGIEKWRKDIARHERIKAKYETKLPGNKEKEMSQTVHSAEQEVRAMLAHLTRNSHTYLDLAAQLERLPPESDEAGDLIAEMSAYVQQVHMDAEDVIEAMDAYTDALPDDDE